MPDAQSMDSVANWGVARPPSEPGGPPMIVPPTLRVEDLGMGLARLAVSQCLPQDVARRVAAILRESGIASAAPSLTLVPPAARRATDRVGRGRRQPVRYRGSMSGS